jgi:hypothetical protein
MSDEFDDAKSEKVQLQKKKRIWASIDSEVHDKFMNYCDRNGYDRSKLLELVIKKFVEVKGV